MIYGSVYWTKQEEKVPRQKRLAGVAAELAMDEIPIGNTGSADLELGAFLMSWEGIPHLRAHPEARNIIMRLCKQLRKSLNKPILNAS